MGGKRASLQWVSLVGVIWLQSINGTNSNFPAYSSDLKQLMSLSQLQLNNLALASDAGKLFGCLAGLAALCLPLWVLLLVGSTLGFVGYGFQYLFLTHQISSLSYPIVFFLTLLSGNGICWINTVCYIVTIRNFPHHRQAAVGLTTSYLGLSPVVYTAFVDVFSSSSTSVKTAQLYMLFNSVFPLIVSLVTAPFMRAVHPEKETGAETETETEIGFVVLFMTTLATGIYAVVTSLRPMSMRSLPWLNVMGLGACLALPLLIPLTEYFRETLEHGCIISREMRVCDVTLEAEPHQGAEEFETNRMKEEADNTAEQKSSAIEDIGVKLMLTRLNFWLYFLIYLCGATLGLVYLNNLGQIADSRGYSKTSSLVSLASAFVFLGRLVPSLLDYAYSRNKSMVPGPSFIVAAMVPMSGAFFLLRHGSSVCLQLSTAIIGLSTGAITAISVTTTTELFGAANFAVNHNVVVANIPVGSFLFGGLAALLYRKHGDEHGRCIGLQCYNQTFMIWGSLSLLGTTLALFLHFRTRKFYSQSR
ncbi:protein NUCLEAR FUSION DEFECTIVE 4 [Silene latifolia]|uniref:protein NUCLEAR FUSION DEFECTIVE 4 n=1 Tax=Silene latifolia TaxID=37657 RepID=UPI003D779D31